MSLPIRILAAAVLLVGVLISLVILEDRARASGQEVVLAMEAVDPRDLLTGHYVALQLTQRMPAGQACPSNMPARNQSGWLALRKVGDRHVLTGGAQTREAARKLGDLAVQGHANCITARTPDGVDGEAATLDIGVDRSHTDQKAAEAMEKQLRARPAGQPVSAFAVVSVGDDGRARLKGVILDGKRTDLDWW